MERQSYPNLYTLLRGKAPEGRLPLSFSQTYRMAILVFGLSVSAVVRREHLGFWQGLLIALAVFISVDCIVRYHFALSKHWWNYWVTLPRPFPLKRVRIRARWRHLPESLGSEAMATLETTAAHCSQIRHVTVQALATPRYGSQVRVQQIEMWRMSEILVGQALDLVLSSRGRHEPVDLAALQEIENQVRAIEADSLLNVGRSIGPLPAVSIG